MSSAPNATFVSSPRFDWPTGPGTASPPAASWPRANRSARPRRRRRCRRRMRAGSRKERRRWTVHRSRSARGRHEREHDEGTSRHQRQRARRRSGSRTHRARGGTAHRRRQGGTRRNVGRRGRPCVGGVTAGLLLAEICMGGLGEVSLFSNAATPRWPWSVAVRSSNPVTACLASQYAGLAPFARRGPGRLFRPGLRPGARARAQGGAIRRLDYRRRGGEELW